LSRDCGFGYNEMMKMPTHILIGLWNAKKGVIEKENEEQKKQQDGQSSSMPNMSSMMSQAKSSMPRMPSSGSIRTPSL